MSYNNLMNAMAKGSSRIAWLSATLGAQHARLVALLQRMRGFGAPDRLSPSMFRKFLDVLDQVAVAKEKEGEIISRIQAVEAKHRFQRKHKTLKHAAVTSFPANDWDKEFDDRDMKDEHLPKWLVWAFILWAFLSIKRPKINQKQQSLTAD